MKIRLLAMFAMLLPMGSVTAQWMTAGPYLQELTTDGVTVVFEHQTPSLSWLEVREKGSSDVTKYYETKNGRVKAYSKILATKTSALPVQNFAIRAEGLKPATQYEYRVCANAVTQINSNGVTVSQTMANTYKPTTWKEFTTQDPNQSEHHIIITSDMHNRPDTLSAILRHLDYKTCDRIVYNGDMTDHLHLAQNVQDPYKGYINTSVLMFAQNKPFEMVRGNHETRGDISRHFMDYFPHKSGHIYNFYRWGDLAMVLLDSGEDKLDDHVEYYGMAAFYPYREQMAKWFAQVIESEDYKTAKYRIIICHFSFLRDTGKPTDEFGAEPHLISLIEPMLNKSGADLLISGHWHPATYVYNGKNTVRSNKFEEYNIGSHTGMRIDIADGNINLKIVDSKGTVELDKTVKDSKSGRKTVFLTTPLN